MSVKKPFHILLSDTQHKVLGELAALEGISKAKYMRKLLNLKIREIQKNVNNGSN